MKIGRLVCCVFSLTVAGAATNCPLEGKAQEKELAIGIANSLTKVFADEAFSGKAADTLALPAARNEYEAGQLVLITGGKGVEKTSVEFGDLVHENQKAVIPRHHIRYNFVGYTAPTRITSNEVLAGRKITDNRRITSSRPRRAVRSCRRLS